MAVPSTGNPFDKNRYYGLGDDPIYLGQFRLAKGAFVVWFSAQG
jgi:hypothetical protein